MTKCASIGRVWLTALRHFSGKSVRSYKKSAMSYSCPVKLHLVQVRPLKYTKFGPKFVTFARRLCREVVM